MVHIQPTKARQVRAKKIADLIPRTLGGSIKEGEGILGGCIAEICTADFFRTLGWDLITNEENKYPTYKRDILLIGKNGRMVDRPVRVEVKCTERTFMALPHYHAHVAKSQYDNQKNGSDYFLFVSLKYKSKQKIIDGRGYTFSEPTLAQIVGYYKTLEIESDFKFRREGEKGDDEKPAVWDEYYQVIEKILPINYNNII